LNDKLKKSKSKLENDNNELNEKLIKITKRLDEKVNMVEEEMKKNNDIKNKYHFEIEQYKEKINKYND